MCSKIQKLKKNILCQILKKIQTIFLTTALLISNALFSQQMSLLTLNEDKEHSKEKDRILQQHNIRES